MRALFILLVGPALAACVMTHGPRAETLDIAQEPRGIMADVRVGKAFTAGELLTASDSTLVLDTGTEITVVRIEHVDRLDLRTLDQRRGRRVRMIVRRDDLAYERIRKEVQSYSRFPFGITAVAEQELLRIRGQASPRRIVP